MFTETMSSKELYVEAGRDLTELQEKTERFNGSQYVTSYLAKRRKQRQVTIFKKFRTSRNNTYLGVLQYVKQNDTKRSDWDWQSLHFGLMYSFKGVCAIVCCDNSQQAVRLTTHFFQRYKERMAKTCDWRTRNQLAMAKETQDIINVFMSRNPFMVWVETKAEFDGKSHIFSPMNDGVALLQWDREKELLQANTFLTFDMLSNSQLAMLKQAVAYISMTDEERSRIEKPDFIKA